MNESSEFTLLEINKSCLSLIPDRPSDGHKGTFGKVLVIAGSKNMAGAAYLSAKAAYRMGAGLVNVMTPEENRIIIQTSLPEALLTTYDEVTEEYLSNELGWADVILLGPGLSQSESAKLITQYVIKNSYVPLVIDADGLNNLSTNIDILDEAKCDIILTPHIAEMSRLFGYDISYIKSNMAKVAREFADKYHVNLVLKDSVTYIATTDGLMHVNRKGNSGMATAGSGDVLAGIITGLIATHTDICNAAYIGPFIHGSAGDYAAESVGETSMMASDIVDNIQFALMN